jgi:hypothetical protein
MIETKNRRSGLRELIPVDQAVKVIRSMLPAFGSAPEAPESPL